MPALSRCTAQLPNGRFCDWPSVPDNPPFPICPRHMRQAYQWATDWLARGGLPRDPVEVARVTAEVAANQQPRPVEIVYYLRVGELIKIGTTVNLRKRLRQYPPNVVLLATEPGGVEVEEKRLREFNTFLAHPREWFRPTPSLLAHIERLAADAA